MTSSEPVTEPADDAATTIVPVVDPDTHDVPHDEPGGAPAEVDRDGASPAPMGEDTAAIWAPDRFVAAPPESATTTAPAPNRRPRVRRVSRVVRHIDTWSVFKVALLFHLVLYVTVLVSGVLLWNVAYGTGTIDNVERFMETFGWETFEFDGQQIFDAFWRVGLFGVVGLTGLAVLAATTFNLITDIVGGVRVTVLEEEVIAAPRPGTRRSEARAARRAARRHG